MYNNYLPFADYNVQQNYLKHFQVANPFCDPPHHPFAFSQREHYHFNHPHQQALPTPHSQFVPDHQLSNVSFGHRPLRNWNFGNFNSSHSNNLNQDNGYLSMSGESYQAGQFLHEDEAYAPSTSNHANIAEKLKDGSNSSNQRTILKANKNKKRSYILFWCSSLSIRILLFFDCLVHILLFLYNRFRELYIFFCQIKVEQIIDVLITVPNVTQTDGLIILGDQEEKLYRENIENNKKSGRNWRCKTLFNGHVHDCDLPQNCERPQTDEGRTFPASRSSFYEFFDQTGDTEKNIDEVEAIERPYFLKAPAFSNSRGYVLANGRTWVSKKLISTDVEPNRKATSIRTETPMFENRNPALALGATKKKFVNSLRIINGKKIYGGTNECYQFAENKKCLSGALCCYQHDKSVAHHVKDLCGRQLRGLCRNSTNCSYGKHLLAEHQIPVCDYFLRMICSEDKCCYLHIKHTEGLDFCANFNRGICREGIRCNKPHRYNHSIIKERGLFLEKTRTPFPTLDNNAEVSDSSADVNGGAKREPVDVEEKLVHESASTDSNSTFKWYS